jgi:hypothetical protein
VAETASAAIARCGEGKPKGAPHSSPHVFGKVHERITKIEDLAETMSGARKDPTGN